MPHSSAQAISYSPVLVAVNDTPMLRPGTASCLTRNCGTKKECVTSLLRSMRRMGRLTGMPIRFWVITSSLPAGSLGTAHELRLHDHEAGGGRGGGEECAAIWIGIVSHSKFSRKAFDARMSSACLGPESSLTIV